MELSFIILMLGLLFGDDKPKKKRRHRTWWQSPSYSEYDQWWHDNHSNKGGWN